MGYPMEDKLIKLKICLEILKLLTGHQRQQQAKSLHGNTNAAGHNICQSHNDAAEKVREREGRGKPYQ